MKNYKKLVLFVVIGILFLTSAFFVTKKILTKSKSEKLINISELSEKFMNEYSEGNKKLQENNNKENIVIVTSMNGIKNNYGATNVVEAPNHQYFLQYKTEEAKEIALQKFESDNLIYSVGENVKYEIELSDIDKKKEQFILNNYSIKTNEYNSWGIQLMGLDNVFEQVSNLNNKILNDVNVAIVDTGLDVNLFNKYYENRLSETYNVIDNSFNRNDMYDNNGHGTHIAGTIAEATPYNIKIFPIKVSDNGNMYTSDIVTAINYITYNEKADVINMSFGSYANDSELAIAIDAANNNNIICVAAAGNENNSTPHYPSALNTTISVASVDSSLNKSLFSNYNETVDFTAPGTAIKSIMGKNASISQNNGNSDDDEHETINGTSMATPHVVSAVAILKSFNEDLNIGNVKELLRKYSIDLGISGKDEYYGYGFITFSQATFCDNSLCDDYNVYSSNDDELNITKIEMVNQDINHIHSNYGNITDLLNLEINIYYDDEYITKKLEDLDNIIIENYDTTFDKDEYGNVVGTKTQEITIKYREKSTTATVMTYSSWGNSWKYEEIDNENIMITGFNTNQINDHPSTIYIPDTINGYTVSEIKDCAFKNDNKLRKVFFPSTIKKIGIEAFYNDINLSYVSTLDYIEEIGESAFKDTNLENFEFSESITSIGANAFENTKIANIYIPKSVNSIGDGAFAGCNNVETIEVDDENTIYDSRNNSNAIIETATNTLIKGNYNTNLENNIEIIGAKAFYNEDDLEEINIPESVTSINSLAFAYDDNIIESILKKVTILRNVIEIETSAFNSNNKTIMIYTYSDAAAKSYAISRNLSYETKDYSNVVSRLVDNNLFNAFDSLSGILRLSVQYNVGYYNNNTYCYNQVKSVSLFEDDISNLDTNKYQITYIDNRNSFRYGDEYVTISGKDDYGNDFEKQITVIVSKATPTFTIPLNLTATTGQTLSEIELPTGFTWMDLSQVITTSGNANYKATYTPLDTTNYKIVNNIDITIAVTLAKTVIVPSIIISDKTCDGTSNLSINNINVSNLNSTDYTITSAIVDSVNVGETTAKIKIKLTDTKFESATLANGNQEYEYIIDMEVIPMVLQRPIEVDKVYTYNESNQEFELNAYNSNTMSISGNFRIDAGEQPVTISLLNTNYIWDNNTTNDLIYTFKIEKAQPVIDYTSSNKTISYDGELHGITLTVTSPNNVIIKYMNSDGNYVLDEMPKYRDIGNYTINYKLSINDNYTDIYGEQKVIINNSSIVNASTDYVGIYDGNKHTINIDINTPNYNIKYSINNTDYDLSTIPEFIKVGEYIINYKVTASGYSDLFGSNKVKIYGVQSFNSPIIQKGNVLILNNNGYNNLTNNIATYSLNKTFMHLNNIKTDIDSDIIKTSDILKVSINNSKSFEYELAYLGDVNGNGNIDIIDYIRIMKDIMGTTKLSGVYAEAADVNRNNKIDIIDYIRIMKIIMEEN